MLLMGYFRRMSSMFIKPRLFLAHQPTLGERLLLPAVGGQLVLLGGLGEGFLEEGVQGLGS